MCMRRSMRLQPIPADVKAWGEYEAEMNEWEFQSRLVWALMKLSGHPGSYAVEYVLDDERWEKMGRMIRED